MAALQHRLDRTVLIRADRRIVFQYFTDNERWGSWWGAGSTIDPRPGGRVKIRYPNGVEALGEVLEIHAPERIVFTYGYVSGTPMGPGASRVTIELQVRKEGTQLHLSHEFAEASARDQHVLGWRFQLSLFANVVANEVHAGAADMADRWFAAWSVADETERQAQLVGIATPEVRFRDRFANIEGLTELISHVGASQRFMPGMHLKRAGDIRHCQGTVLVDWIAVNADGAERMRGSSVFVLVPDGKIDSVTSFSAPSPTP
jgi:uncharacterized protein YndB with AHSA1/START domain